MFYSNVYSFYRCRNCAMHTGVCECSAVVCGGYMTHCETGEIIDDCVEVYDGTEALVPMCDWCASAATEECYDDDERHVDYVYTDDTGRYYSRGYAEDYLYQCDECGSWFEDANSLSYIGGGHYCRDCRQYHSVICSYHDHRGEYSPVGGDWCDDLIGLEIESDYYGGAEADCAEALDCEFNSCGRDVLAFEEDCSLSEGFETITHPHTLEALRDFDFGRLCDMMMEYGACSNPSTAGLHMHFSRSWFGETTDEQQATAGRLMLEYACNWDVLVALSNRGDSYSINNYAQPPAVSDMFGRQCSLLEYGACGELEIYDENVGGWGCRYRAINCENYATIEFRLGAGLLDASYIRAWIELHVAMVRAARAGQAFRVNYDYTITILDEGRQAA